jgi:hypothetical protein
MWKEQFSLISYDISKHQNINNVTSVIKREENNDLSAVVWSDNLCKRLFKLLGSVSVKTPFWHSWQTFEASWWLTLIHSVYKNIRKDVYFYLQDTYIM